MSDLVGRRVIVRNPHLEDTAWSGFAVAWSDQPTLLIEDDESGARLMLPAAWAVVDPSGASDD